MAELLTVMKCEIKETEVLRFQGYRRGKFPEGEASEILRREIEEGYHLVEPKAIYAEAPIERIEDEEIILDGNLRLKVGKNIREWEGAEYLGMALCTVGSALEERVAQLFAQQDFAAALMLDSVGSVVAENAADQTNHLLCLRAKAKGLGTGPRLSPGYGKWRLLDQKVLFSILPAEKIGMKLNEQCMMTPRKSVSFCLGIGKSMKSRIKANPCRYCGMESCQYRKRGD